MEEMEYEHLLRIVFNSARTNKNGADADFYRLMNRNHNNLDSKSMYESQDEREIAFQESFVPVRNNVQNAIIESKRKLSGKATTQELLELDSISKELNHRFYNKERLDTIINEVSDLYSSYNKA